MSERYFIGVPLTHQKLPLSSELVNLAAVLMKAIATILFAAAFLVMFTIVSTSAQTVAIGHVTAEVVESVSATSMAIAGFDLKIGNDLAALSLDEQYDNLNLGAIKIKSGNGIACNVVLKAATLSDTKGNGFIIEPTVNNFQGAAQSTGNETLHLKGNAHLAKGQAAGLYQGTYTMVFAFN